MLSLTDCLSITSNQYSFTHVSSFEKINKILDDLLDLNLDLIIIQAYTCVRVRARARARARFLSGGNTNDGLQTIKHNRFTEILISTTGLHQYDTRLLFLIRHNFYAKKTKVSAREC